MLIDNQQRRFYPKQWVILSAYGKRKYYLQDFSAQLKRVIKRNGFKFLEGNESVRKGADRYYITLSTKDFFTIKNLLNEKEI